MKTFLKTYFSKKIILCWVLALLVFIIGWIAQNRQNHIKIEIGANTPSEIFRVVAQSLLILVPFVGVMISFGFEKIRTRMANQSTNLENLRKSWNNGKNLFFGFSFYTFSVVLLNLLLLVFDEMIGFSFGILLGDIALVFGALYLVIGIAAKIYDVDLDVINHQTEKPKSSSLN